MTDDRITFDRLHRPFIRDTGIGLWQFLDWIAAGTEDDVLREHREIEPGDFGAAYRWGLFLLVGSRAPLVMREFHKEIKAKLALME